MTVYRFQCDELGTYAAVERDCPQGDPRRNDKPDGSWVPKVGERFPGCISFWKKDGLKKYQESGLRDWHSSVISGETRLLIAKEPTHPVYQDEFQVVAPPEAFQIVKTYPFQYCGPRPWKVSEHLNRDSRPKFIRHTSVVRDWNAYAPYPQSSETFSIGACLGQELGLSRLAVNHELFLPQTRSSFPHCHKIEEEAVYVLEGCPDVWINGRIYPAKPGDFFYFPPATAYAHCILNSSQENVSVLVFGEQDKEEDWVYYPMNDDRNEEMRQWGWLWEDRPSMSYGNHPGTIQGEPTAKESRPRDLHLQCAVTTVKPKTQGGLKDKDFVYFND